MAARKPAKAPKADKAKNKGGRPSTFSQAKVDLICERLSKGEPLAVICRDPGMPDDDTVRNWADARPEVARAIARAREVGEDAIVQEAMAEIDRAPEMIPTQFGLKVDPGDVALRKLRFEARFKLLSKWNPKRWGDRIQHANDPDNPLPAPQFIVQPTKARDE